MAAALGVSLLTMFSMTKIWAEVFWKPAPEEALPEACGEPHSMTDRFSLYGPILLLATFTVGIGLMAGPVMKASLATARQLLDQDAYIQAVLPNSRLPESEAGAADSNADIGPLAGQRPAAQAQPQSPRGGTAE